jgi:RNA-binding protein 5/10
LLYYILSFAGPTHVLVVRGLEENADEEMLRYEFAKHAPIKVGKSQLL